MRPQWLPRALDFDAYLAGTDMNVPTMRENFAGTVLNPQDDAYFEFLDERLSPGEVVALALSESWCGDCVENLPVLCKIAARHRFLKVHIFPRDQNLDIMDQYLTRGRRTIPVFVFFDYEGTEIGRFVERPPGAHEFMKKAMESVSGLFAKEQQRRIYKARAELRRMYKAGFRQETVAEIAKILQERYEF